MRPRNPIIRMNREDIIEKVFPHSLFGYDPVAVDSFLDEVIREFDRMTNTIDVLQFRLSQELGEARQMNDCLTHMLSRSEFEGRVEQLIASGHEEPAPAAAPQEGHGALSSADEAPIVSTLITNCKSTVYSAAFSFPGDPPPPLDPPFPLSPLSP